MLLDQRLPGLHFSSLENKKNQRCSAEPKSRGKIKEEKIESIGRTSPTDFSFTITKVAVSQICRSVGFKSTQFSALETLTLTATKYLETLGKLAASFSHASNRTESNLLDLINALHDLYSFKGFPGASDLHLTSERNCLLKSFVLKEISDFVSSTYEIPFAKPIPRENWTEELISNPANGVDTPHHIPKWLPAFPDASTDKEESALENCSRKLWENSDLVQNSCCGKILGQNLGNGDLPKERERVAFKLGVEGNRNGVFRGGKSVCLYNNNTTVTAAAITISDSYRLMESEKSQKKRRR